MRFHADELSCSMGSFGRVRAVVSGSRRELREQLVGEASRTDRIVLFTIWLSQGNSLSCRGKMRSSSLGKVESSALMRHGGTQRGAVDVGTRPGSAESLACREPATYHPSASRPRAGGEQPMGTGPAATDETGGRWWGGAPVTGTTLEPQTAPEAETAGGRSVQ